MLHGRELDTYVENEKHRPKPSNSKKKKAKIHALTVIQELEKDLNPQV